jgi:putative hydrolase of the HAD superfamily
MMKNYSVIVFDLGNVLLPFDYTKPVNRFNEIQPGLGDRFAALYRKNYNVHRDFEKGILSEEEYLAAMMKWLENTVTPEKFCKEFSDVFTLSQNVIDLIPGLKKKYSVLLLSNTNSIHYKYGYCQYEFLNLFDKLFLSYEIGAAKPEEAIYRAVETYTRKPSSEHLFIDDIKEYVEGAKACGWDAIQFKGYQNLVKELDKRGVEIGSKQ